MKKRIIWIVTSIIVLVFAGIFYFNNHRQNPTVLENDNLYETGGNEAGSNEVGSNEAYIAEINSYVEEIKTMKEKDIKIYDDTNITELEIGSEATDFMNTLEVNQISGNIKVYDTKAIFINPYSDFLDIQNYYYKENKLVLYSREFMGIGGFVNYYFKDGKLVDIKTQIEEEMTFTPENVESIVPRSDNLYRKFIDEVYFSVTLPSGVKLRPGLKGNIEELINQEIVKTEEINTDWPNVKLRDVEYKDFSIKILLGEKISDNTLIKISTTSDKLLLGKGAKIGDSLDDIQKMYDNQLIKGIYEYSGENYELCEYDESYEVDISTKGTIFYMKDSKLVGIEILNPIDA